MSFMAGSWLHDPPVQEYDESGKRAIVRHLCFGPLETRTWYELVDGQYCCELHTIEGPQAGERFVDPVRLPDMRKVIDTEIALCQECGRDEVAALFQVEREKLDRLISSQ